MAFSTRALQHINSCKEDKQIRNVWYKENELP